MGDIVIPRADLPEVVEEGNLLRVGGESASVRMPAAKHRQIARHHLAVAEYLDAREAREAEAAKEAELTKRRDALANELFEKVYGEDQLPRGYASRTAMMRDAINRIIEAEGKLAKYEAQEQNRAKGFLNGETNHP